MGREERRNDRDDVKTKESPQGRLKQARLESFLGAKTVKTKESPQGRLKQVNANLFVITRTVTVKTKESPQGRLKPIANCT